MFDRLLILGSSLTALAVVRDTHAHGLEPVVVDGTDGIAFRSRYTTPCLIPDVAGDEAVLERIASFGGSGSAVIATGDPWVRFVIRQRSALEAAFGSVLHPSNKTLETCLDKQRFSEWCIANGLDAPKSWLAGAESRPAGLEFPLLVRPAQTLHGGPRHGLPKAAEVHSESELVALLTRFASAGCQAIASESLLGQDVTQYSVPFARSGSGLISFVARKVRPSADRCSVGTFVELAPEPRVEALARRAVDALDYFGVGEVEILRAASGRASLIEINARPWLQYALAPASGHDFLGLLLGTNWKANRRREGGRSWIDLPSDLFGALSSSEGVVRNGQLSLVRYAASLVRANVFARFDWRDPAPAFHRTPQARRSNADAAVEAAVINGRRGA